MKLRSVSAARKTGVVGLGRLEYRVQNDRVLRFRSFCVNLEYSADAMASLGEALLDDQAHG